MSWSLLHVLQRVLGDEKHLVFECPALPDLRHMICIGMGTGSENLFQGPQGPTTDAMLLFMWQDEIIGVARIIDAILACLSRKSSHVTWTSRREVLLVGI